MAVQTRFLRRNKGKGYGYNMGNWGYNLFIYDLIYTLMYWCSYVKERKP